jgi:hypothetical protein
MRHKAKWEEAIFILDFKDGHAGNIVNIIQN